MIKERSVISDVKTYAKTQIKEVDRGAIRCGIFDNLSRACRYISMKDGIKEGKVYPALRSIGYNLIYHDDSENIDLLEELSDIINPSILQLNANMLDSHTSNYFGSDMDSFVCRIRRTAQKEILECAGKHCIQVSTLVMYHTMLGIRELVESDREYTTLKESNVGKDVLSRLNEFEIAIKNRIFDVKHGGVVYDVIREEMPSYNEKFIQMNVDVSSIGLEFVEYEHQMNIGRVDILCKSDDGFVLGEVKKGIAGTDVIGQVLKYVCTFNEPCKGMIIAEGFSKQVVNAAKQLGIDLVKYAPPLNSNTMQHIEIRRL